METVTRVDRLGLSIADAGYEWTPAMREAFEQASEAAQAAAAQYTELEKARDMVARLAAELAEVYGNDSARDAVALLRNAVAKGFQFALCVEAEKSTACLHNTDDGKVCARMLERFARQQREAEAT